jgi:hypothetical protein
VNKCVGGILSNRKIIFKEDVERKEWKVGSMFILQDIENR